jgi:hypothetical protein
MSKLTTSQVIETIYNQTAEEAVEWLNINFVLTDTFLDDIESPEKIQKEIQNLGYIFDTQISILNKIHDWISNAGYEAEMALDANDDTTSYKTLSFVASLESVWNKYLLEQINIYELNNLLNLVELEMTCDYSTPEYKQKSVETIKEEIINFFNKITK